MHEKDSFKFFEVSVKEFKFPLVDCFGSGIVLWEIIGVKLLLDQSIWSSEWYFQL